VQLKRY